MSRSMIGGPLEGSRSGFPGVARIRGADPDNPPCHTVPRPRYAAAMITRISAFGFLRAINGTNSADATTLKAQLK